MGSKRDPLKGVPQISEKKLKSLLRQADKAHSETRSISGDLGEAIRGAIENDHLHRKAFAMVKALHRIKESEKLADLYYHFMLYCDMSGVLDRVESVPSLKLVHDAEKKEAEAEEPKPQTEAAE